MLNKSKNNKDLVESLSGIRGIYGQGITPGLAYRYAYNYCQLFKNKITSLVVGNDGRSSCLSLGKAITQAFEDSGVKKIIDFGILPIQVCEYGILKYKVAGGFYITASHNEPEYNGWKILKEDGALLYPEQAEKLIKLVHESSNLKLQQKVKSKTEIVNKNKEIIEKYIDFILRKISSQSKNKIKKSGLKILIDPNGGSAIFVLERLFKKLGAETEIINNKIGKFVRLVEPDVKSLAYLNKKMIGGNFAFACGFDSDGDRVELVLPPESKFIKKIGPVLSGQYVLAMACDIYLERTKNQIVTTNDCTSYLVRDIIKKYNARMKEAEVGEMNVVKEMEKNKSIIGGEGSNGGVIISPIKCRDGIMTVALILKMLAERNKSLDEILKNYPHYYSERSNVYCPAQTVVKIKNKLENYFRRAGLKIKKTGDFTGGLKIFFDHNSYLWFRPSRTEAGVFRIIADGDNHQEVKNMLKKGIKAFNKFSR